MPNGNKFNQNLNFQAIPAFNDSETRRERERKKATNLITNSDKNQDKLHDYL